MWNELLSAKCRLGAGMHQGLRVTCCESMLSQTK